MTSDNWLNMRKVAATRQPNVSGETQRPGRALGASSLLLTIFLALSHSIATAQQPPASFGMTFTFSNVDESQVSKCATGSRASTVRNSVFITRYDQPAIRSQVQHRLSEMRLSGFQDVRLLVFFGPDAKSSDWFDIKDGDRAGELLKLYLADVKAAGFTELFLAFAVQGTASPTCRKEKWGDCFDSSSIALTTDFMSKVRNSLGAAPPLRMRFDLALEMCSPPDLPQPMRGYLLQYSKATIASYTARFPRDETTMSCSLARFPKGRQSIDESYAAAGAKPAFYDIHAYNRADQDEEALFREVTSELKTSKIPLVIGETSYGDKNHFQALLQDLAKPTERLQAIYFWPLKVHASRCTADIAPPYTLEAAKGR